MPVFEQVTRVILPMPEHDGQSAPIDPRLPKFAAYLGELTANRLGFPKPNLVNEQPNVER